MFEPAGEANGNQYRMFDVQTVVHLNQTVQVHRATASQIAESSTQ